MGYKEKGEVMTTMYFKNQQGQVLVHHFDFERESSFARDFIKKGFTFDNPNSVTTDVSTTEIDVNMELTCNECGKLCKSKLGLNAHKRSHK